MKSRALIIGEISVLSSDKDVYKYLFSNRCEDLPLVLLTEEGAHLQYFDEDFEWHRDINASYLELLDMLGLKWKQL